MRPELRLSILAVAFAAACASTYGEPETTNSVTVLPELPVTPGDSATPKSTFSQIWHWSDAQLRGVFDIVLPDTQERGTWKLEFQPRVWDFVDEDYVRVPFGVTYGFNSRSEGQLMLGSYFANPWGEPEDNGVGIANIRAGFKRKWKPTAGSQINAASGVEVTRPIPSSPAVLNQGINRGSFFITGSRRFTSGKQLEGVLNLSYDLITPSSAAGFIPEDMPQDDFFRISPGVLHHHGRLTYGLSTGWSHTVDGPPANFFSLTPSVIYEIPPKYIFNSPGRWQLGLAVEGKHFADDYDVEFRMRVRWLGSIARVYKDWRDQRRANAVAAASRTSSTGR